ncbi:MAG: DUF1801 domain-containing protein [Prolixibacteraceae bacterium]|nr:DUF1801 domain-containing protein [Prolixibacteraceae bacterium]
MKHDAESPEQYIEMLPDGRKEAMKKLRQTICDHLPEGFEETMSYGMIGYVVPHSVYPKGYHSNPKLPLPFVSIASQKNFIVLYHSGIYADKYLLDWFTNEYTKSNLSRLDMGKSCIRFKKAEQIPYDLIASLISKISVNDWIRIYESAKNGNGL